MLTLALSVALVRPLRGALRKRLTFHCLGFLVLSDLRGSGRTYRPRRMNEDPDFRECTVGGIKAIDRPTYIW